MQCELSKTRSERITDAQGWTGNRAYRAFSRWADALKGPTDFFFFAGTTSSQWPIGLSPALTA